MNHGTIAEEASRSQKSNKDFVENYREEEDMTASDMYEDNEEMDPADEQILANLNIVQEN